MSPGVGVGLPLGGALGVGEPVPLGVGDGLEVGVRSGSGVPGPVGAGEEAGGWVGMPRSDGPPSRVTTAWDGGSAIRARHWWSGARD